MSYDAIDRPTPSYDGRGRQTSYTRALRQALYATADTGKALSFESPLEQERARSMATNWARRKGLPLRVVSHAGRFLWAERTVPVVTDRPSS